MTNDIEIKKQLAVQAAETEDAPETLAGLYAEKQLKPAKHKNPLTNKYFHGLNVWQLELVMLLNDYTSCNWSTFAQYKKENKSVAKGEHGTYLTLAVYNTQKNEETGEDEEILQFFKGYTVFNAEQIKAAEAKTETKKAAVKPIKKDNTNKIVEKWEQQGLFKIA